MEERGVETSGRTVLGVAGGIAALLAAGLVAVGVGLLWLSSQRDADGFFTTGPHHFESPTFAISSSGLEVVADAPRWLFDADRIGTVRIRSTGSSKPIFVGVARAADVRRFLADVPHEVATAVGTHPFDVSYAQAIGSRPPRSPAAQRFWAASDVIRGHGALAWDVRRGHWAVVVMNADGSAGIDARLELGAKVGFLAPTGAGLVAGGAVIFLGSVFALVYGLRGRLDGAPPIPPPVGMPEHELETA